MVTRKTPERKTTASRKNAPARKQQGGKSRSRRRTPKPKIRLSSRKVYALSVFIVLVCAACLALSVLATGPELSQVTSPSTSSSASQKKSSQSTPVVTEKPSSKESASITPKASAPVSAKTKETVKTTPKETVKPAQKEAAAPAKKEAAVPAQKEGTTSAHKETSPSVSKENVVHSPAVKQSVQKESEVKTPAAKEQAQKTTAAVSTPDRFPNIVPAVNGATLTFVFDDGGHNIQQLEKFLALPFPVDIAVLPRLAHSAECARLIRASGRHQVMLHQPMQALNPKVNPGAGAILPHMHVQEIMETLRANIAEIGPIAGLNNHEGSAICENEIQIGAVLDEAKAQGIFFLDSRTTAQTRAPQAALERGMTLYERDIFLDNEKTRENILNELYKGLTIANKKGRVIMIGHVWSADILPAVLTEVYPELVKKGYRFALVK